MMRNPGGRVQGVAPIPRGDVQPIVASRGYRRHLGTARLVLGMLSSGRFAVPPKPESAGGLTVHWQVVHSATTAKSLFREDSTRLLFGHYGRCCSRSGCLRT